MMTKLIFEEWTGIWSMWEEIVVMFANTGEEHEKTLVYVKEFSEAFKIPVVWVEAVIDPEKGGGTRHKVVSFETASRKGEPFEAMCAKYGLPNTQYLHCTRESKLHPMTSYLRSIGWDAETYNTAIGIRVDEIDRMSPTAMEAGYIYPMIDWRVTKHDVYLWNQQQPVKLDLPEHLGNCTWCWKKSFRKLATVAQQMPQAFDFPRMLEEKYKDAGGGEFGDRRLFRGRKTVADIFELARSPYFAPFKEDNTVDPYFQPELDIGMSCGESCEIGVEGAPQ